MTIRRIPELPAWPDLALEALLKLGGRFQPTAESSWPLPPALRDRVRIRWPSVYQWQHMPRWGDQILDLLRRRLHVVIADITQQYHGTVQCEFEIDGRVHKVAFNISDYPDFVDGRCTQESLVTFKFQFREQGYGDQRIVPGGYLPGSKLLYSLLTYLRWGKDHLKPEFDVYGRFGMEFSPGVRGEALRRMNEATAFRFYGGERLVRYSRYLREVARSQVCLDLPGQGPICFRLVEYLAIGACIVAYPHQVVFPGSLADKIPIVYCRKPEDLIERCETLLGDRPRQKAMTTAARAYFDRYLHRDQLSAYYLNVVLAAAGVS
jgi:hypothetical protein